MVFWRAKWVKWPVGSGSNGKKPVQLNQPRVDPTAMSVLVIGVIWNILEQNKPQTSQNKQKSLQWIAYIHLIISSIPSTSSTFHVTRIPTNPTTQTMASSGISWGSVASTNRRSTGPTNFAWTCHRTSLKVSWFTVGWLVHLSKPLWHSIILVPGWSWLSGFS